MIRFSRPVRFSSTAAYCPARPMRVRDLLRLLADVEAEHLGATAVGLQDRRENAHRRGLAGSVGSEQAEHGAGRDRQVDTVECDDVAEALDEALGVDRWLVHGLQPSRR